MTLSKSLPLLGLHFFICKNVARGWGWGGEFQVPKALLVHRDPGVCRVLCLNVL